MIRIPSDAALLQNKGTQPKWLIDNEYIKVDDLGYEGLAETIASDILAKSNIGAKQAVYRPVEINYRGTRYTGCRSQNFLLPHDKLVEGNDILEAKGYNSWRDLQKKSDNDVRKTIRTFAGLTKGTTGCRIAEFLCKEMEFDSLIGNMDRNGGNIAVIRHPDGKTEPVIFDHGRSLVCTVPRYADDPEYWHGASDVFGAFGSFTSRQAEAAETMFGERTLFRTSYTLDDLEKSLDKCSGIYPDKALDNTKAFVKYQFEQYPQYLLSPDRMARIQEMIHVIMQNYSDDFRPMVDNGDLSVSLKAMPQAFLLFDPYGETRVLLNGQTADIFDLIRRAENPELMNKMQAMSGMVYAAGHTKPTAEKIQAVEERVKAIREEYKQEPLGEETKVYTPETKTNDSMDTETEDYGR